MPRILITVDASAGQGIRLDRWLASIPGAITRSRLKNGLSLLTVNDSPAKLSRVIHPGDTILAEWEDETVEGISAENIPLDIIYEDANVTVVNKQSGMVTHPAAGNWTGTLVNALLWRWSTIPVGDTAEARIRVGEHSEGALRPGIVHRLDKDTSGLIITARNPETEAYLQGLFKTRRVKKIYLAIVCGRPKERERTIETNIARDPKSRKKFIATAMTSPGKRAKTSYRVIASWEKHSLIAFVLHTGRTHQIRVHCKYLGFPILGDPIYGRKDHTFPHASLMLHAWRLSLNLPDDENRTRFEAPVPERMKAVIDALNDTGMS